MSPTRDSDPSAAVAVEGVVRGRRGGLGPIGWTAAAVLLCGALYAFQPQENNAQTRAARRMPSFGGAAADSNNRMVAVTGLDITGQSVLYLVDTENMTLAVYQAAGGTSATQGVKLVGARNISLDMQLDGFNDQTESQGRPLGFKDLESQFQKNGLLPAPDSED